MRQEEMERGKWVTLTIPPEVCLNDPVLRFRAYDDAGPGPKRKVRILDIINYNKFGGVARVDFDGDTRLLLAEWLTEAD